VTGTALGLTVFGTLAGAGLLHLLRPRTFRDALREQRLLPERTAVAVAGAVTAAEIVVGVAGAAAFGFSGQGARVSALAAAAIFGVFTAYSGALVMRGGTVPCGCAGNDLPVSVWVVARAAALALAAIGAAIAPVTPLTYLPPVQAAVAAVAAATFGTLLWAYPDALFDPMDMPLVRTALQR
jgi:hypothetical protein